MDLVFEWDPRKDQANLEKHRITFSEATTVFGDPLARIFADEDHSTDEQREIMIGHSQAKRLLLVSFTEPEVGRVRIISARRATAEDERRYRQGRGEPGAPSGKRAKAERRNALAEVARARLDALRRLGLVVPGDDGGFLPPRGPRGGLWRPLEYGLVYEGPARRVLGLSRNAFRALVLPTAWVKNPLYSTAPKVGVYDPCALVEIGRALHDNRSEWLAQCRAFVSRRRDQIDADVRVEHGELMRRARDWQELRRERAEERRFWARAARTRTENVRGDHP